MKSTLSVHLGPGAEVSGHWGETSERETPALLCSQVQDWRVLPPKGPLPASPPGQRKLGAYSEAARPDTGCS